MKDIRKRFFGSTPLKITRNGFAIAVFLLFLLALLGVQSVAGVMRPLYFLQVFPSFIRFLSIGMGAAAVGWVVVVISTLIFGRVYCSVLCPLGLFQDLVLFLRSPLKQKRWKGRRPSFIGFIVLGLTLITIGLGTVVVVQLTDPYAIFSRMVTDLLKPVLVGMNNSIAAILKQFGVYSLDFRRIHFVDIPTLAVALGLSVLVTVFSVFRGRQFCNTLCPVGALLRVSSVRPLLAVRVKRDSCTECGICTAICRAGCIDLQEQPAVDTSRCILCLDCVDACPHKALRYGYKPIRSPLETTDRGRRDFLRGGVLLTGSAAIGITVSKTMSKTPLSHDAVPAIPPGAKGFRRYSGGCVACHQCVAVCPTRVLRPAFAEFGVQGIMLPVMDYHRGFCEYECTNCNHVCPSGALTPLPLAVKKRTQLGTVSLFEDRCVVFDKGEDCGACAEVCPTHAVTTEKRGLLHFPVVDTGPCIGCGACEHACPVMPKAIMVEASFLHGTAEAPHQVEEQQPQNAGEEEFPF